MIGGRRERSAEWAGLPEEPTWDDTAALIGGLPLVITVNIAVAHLEGSHGTTWLMLKALAI